MINPAFHTSSGKLGKNVNKISNLTDLNDTFTTILHEILDASEQAINKASTYKIKRPFYKVLNKASPNLMVALSGLRGTGKTTLLLQYAYDHMPQSVYISLDQFKGIDLYEVIKTLYTSYSKTIFLLDEISYIPDWQQHLKKAFDRIRDITIIFTSSISLELIRTKIDLARRVVLFKLPPLSLREYLVFHSVSEADNIELTSLCEILFNFTPSPQVATFDAFLPEYLKFPLAVNIVNKEPKIFQNILSAIIERDLVFTYGLTVEDINNIYNILKFLGASVGDVNRAHISKNTGISYKLVQKYLDLLQKAYVLNLLMPAGTDVRKQPKILFNLPFRLVFSADWRIDLNVHKGMLLEDFAAEMLIGKGYGLHYLKTKRGSKTPDLLVNCAKEGYKPIDNTDEVFSTLQNTTAILEIGTKRKYKVSYKLDYKGKIDIFKLTYPYINKANIRPLSLLGNLW